ncbi:F0F1 ATP synthase subunit delta [Actinoplanes couchii]|uniref:ATP synthase subunit delta n=1 Tax=Actinoplanes couchii TaxID=403638 RepID=A0ABQ3X5W9_9ACTN|nr:F0F1 ATP synthase subunit delta [Actinoplanes couchii]MDR6325406.1 F-type H+-transporting ATPase subunit delta [Actinoplanes couchii]GID53891.1 ATP synthase subunit delta [Actinoplanes couchii]
MTSPTVSREAYGEASARLAAETATATAPQLVTVADEILSVAGLLRSDLRLRRALTDPSRPGADRAELIKSLLSGKVSKATVDTISTLVTGRFARPGQLLDATEHLGVDALLTSAERDGKLGDVEDELFRFGQISSGDSALAAALSDASASLSERVKLVEDLLKSKTQPATFRLVEVALTGFGGRGFAASLNRLVEATAEKRDREVAYVTVAKPLTEAEEQSLAGKLSAVYGRDVSLKVDVVPSVLGGVSVRVGSDLYDGTVQRKLNAAKQAFA